MADDVVLIRSDGSALPFRQVGSELCLSIEPHTHFDGPLFLTYHKGASTLRLTVKKNASLHLIEDTSEETSSLKIEICEGAFMKYSRLFLNRTRSKTTSLHADIHAGGSLVCRTASALPMFASNCSISLLGAGATAALYGLSLLPSFKTSQQTLFVDHRAENTSSFQLVKGLAAEGSSGLVENHVRMCKAAQRSSSRQYSHFLTLGASAKAVHKPTFEIFADDVSASHGATTGMIDEEALFYLRARGLDAKEARRHLIDGFCEEIIRELPREAAPLLRQRIDELLA